jgi:dihydroflavonol-4-reductase
LRILITGATGLLGNNVARIASCRGHDIWTLSRSSAEHPSLCGLNCRQISADLSKPGFESALEKIEVDVVVHAAALIHIGWRRAEESIRVNQSGTQAILEWAARKSIRAIYVSTVNALAIGSQDSPADEETRGDGQIPCSYVQSKRAAQVVCDRFIDSGVDCYAVYPGFMIGPYDWQLSSGRMIQALQRFQPWAPSGGCSVCDPRDVADAILKIALVGGQHRHYILAGENLPYFDLWTRIAKKLNARPPVVTMRRPARVIGRWIANVVNSFAPHELDFNSAAIAMSQQFHYYSSLRAEREYGYRPRPMEKSLDDSIDWLREHRLLRS